MEPKGIHDLTAAYALDALDPHETESFEEHLRHCEGCRLEVADLHEGAGSLAYAAPPAQLPHGLRGRILEQARADRGNVIPFPTRRRRVTWALSAATAVAASAAIAFGVWATMLNDDLGAQRSAHNRVADALAIVAAPGTTHVDLTGANGSLAVGQSGRAVLVISDLKKAPAGKTYEAWVLGGSKPAPAGLLDGGRRAILLLTHPVARGSTVGVTVERDGGVAQPSGSPILAARFS